MFECADVTEVVAAGDPRTSERFFRCLPGDGGSGSVLLVGVVHDHPASVSRVARLLERVTPDVLALELPPLAVPLFDWYARDVYTPPRLGGEMSMALQAAGNARTVGIDAPTVSYLRSLARTFISGRAPLDLLGAALVDLAGAIRHAVVCRIGSVFGRLTGLRIRLYTPITYDSTVLDTPTDQAVHEDRHLAQQRAFIRAITVPPIQRVIDGTRETSMAAQLDDLRAEGDVVAVLGMEHLDAVAEGLQALTKAD